MTPELRNSTLAWGIGLATKRNTDGTVLDVWFPEPKLGPAEELKDPWLRIAEHHDELIEDELRNVTTDVTVIEIELAAAPKSTEDVYLRLQLLSHRLVPPNSINLDGIFGLLPNNVWTNRGPVHPSDYQHNRMKLQAAGVSMHSLDKFPRMLDYVLPEGVRIADANRVRLGAHLASGTTVMHEGFVNFNAGTLGPSMVEGRISQGVVVGAGSDIGGGASIMGTLSGGGKERISIGQRSLLGANSGIGISLGDDCVVEAGLYITAGTRITLPTSETNNNLSNRQVKAAELSGINGLLFRRNSQTGAVEALARAGAGIALNKTLHA